MNQLENRKLNNKQDGLFKEAWKYAQTENMVAAIAIYRNLEMQLEQLEQFSSVVDCLIEEAKCWKNARLDVPDQKVFFNAVKALINQTEFLIKQKEINRQPHWDFEIGHTLVTLGDYEEAIKRLQNYQNLVNPTPQQKLEIDGFIGYAKFMLGEKDVGLKMLKEVIVGFEKFDLQKDEFQGIKVDNIKYTGALIRLASITEDKDEAIKLANKALKVSKTENLGTRVKAAEQLLQQLKTK